MTNTTYIFWISLAILFYTYLGYGILGWILAVLGRRRNRVSGAPQTGEVTLVIAAYREDGVLEEKIRNSLSLAYPVQVLLVIDGETSLTGLAGFDPRLRVIYQPERLGKHRAIMRAMEEVHTPFVMFSDANCMLSPESVGLMLRHFADPATGAVAGEKRIVEKEGRGVGEAEGIYWKYESFLKQVDANLYTVIGAAGELYMIRRELFRPAERPVILDDFLITMQICLQGYRMAYEKNAVATEEVQSSLRFEAERKSRIAAGAYQVMVRLARALNPFRYGWLSFQYISRRLFRWVLCPPLILAATLANIRLVEQGARGIYLYSLAVLGALYILALAGWLIIRSGRKAGWAGIPFYFIFMNHCLVRGFFRFLGKKQTATWEKKPR